MAAIHVLVAKGDTTTPSPQNMMILQTVVMKKTSMEVNMDLMVTPMTITAAAIQLAGEALVSFQLLEGLQINNLNKNYFFHSNTSFTFKGQREICLCQVALSLLHLHLATTTLMIRKTRMKFQRQSVIVINL